MGNIAITNNCLICETMYDLEIFEDIEFSERTVLDVLFSAKGKIKKGALLLTNPYIGGVLPTEQPFKTLVLLEAEGPVDFNSLKLINNALAVIEKAEKSQPKSAWLKTDLLEFRKVDLVAVERWLRKIYYKR